MKKYRILSGLLAAFALLVGCHAHERNDSVRREAALRPLPDYPFIRYGDNTLQFPSGRADFDTLYHKMDSLLSTGKGKINILHIGGSHVQAGYLSHRLRMNFSTLGDSVMTARGVVFPFRILRTNAPQNYRIGFTGTWESCRCIKPNGTDTLGLTGAAVSTGDPSASLMLRLNPADIRIHTGEGGRFTLTGILPENDRDGLVYHAVGINGADIPAWLRCRHLPEDLKLIRPDLAVFGIGINDANVPPQKFDPEQFKAHYRELIALFKSANPHCALLFVTNNDCLLNLGRRHGKRTNPNTARVAKAFKELAAETGGAVWDQYHIMGGSRSSALWRGKRLMRPDRIHFTAEGYHLIGDMLYNAIITDYLQADGN